MNHGKSRYVFLGSEEFKEKTRREAKEAPVMMGSHIMEESSEEKYLGDQIRTDGLAATTTILSTINNGRSKVIGKINIIMNLAKKSRMMGMRNSLCAQTLYESEIVTSLLNNSA